VTIAMTAKPMDPNDSSPPGGAVRHSLLGPAVRLPLGRLAAWKFGSGIAAALVAGVVGAAAGPGFDVAGAGLGTLCVVLGAVMSMIMVGAANMQGRPIFNWATLVMAGSMVRLLASLAIAVGFYFAAEPAKAPFFAAFLAGSLAVLSAETVYIRGVLLALSRTTGDTKNTESA
jgi:hypothetical protein